MSEGGEQRPPEGAEPITIRVRDQVRSRGRLDWRLWLFVVRCWMWHWIQFSGSAYLEDADTSHNELPRCVHWHHCQFCSNHFCLFRIEFWNPFDKIGWFWRSCCKRGRLLYKFCSALLLFCKFAMHWFSRLTCVLVESLCLDRWRDFLQNQEDY